MCSNNDMVGDEVAKHVISHEQEIIGPGNLEADHFVKKDDAVVLGQVDKT